MSTRVASFTGPRLSTGCHVGPRVRFPAVSWLSGTEAIHLEILRESSNLPSRSSCCHHLKKPSRCAIESETYSLHSFRTRYSLFFLFPCFAGKYGVLAFLRSPSGHKDILRHPSTGDSLTRDLQHKDTPNRTPRPRWIPAPPLDRSTSIPFPRAERCSPARTGAKPVTAADVETERPQRNLVRTLSVSRTNAAGTGVSLSGIDEGTANAVSAAFVAFF